MIGGPYDEKNGHNLQRGNGLNFRRGRRGLLRTFVLKGKPTNFYNKTRRGVGICYTSHSVPVRRRKTSPVTFLHFIWVGIRCQCGGAL